jgi:hypothetical protein
METGKIHSILLTTTTFAWGACAVSAYTSMTSATAITG